jgi:hypothetical protein
VFRPGPVAVHYLFLLALSRTQHVLEAVEHLVAQKKEKKLRLKGTFRRAEPTSLAPSPNTVCACSTRSRSPPSTTPWPSKPSL